MRKESWLKSLAGLAVCVFGTFIAVSCTSDAFFGLEEDYEGVNYSTLKEIAQSKEYVEFQKQSLLSAELMKNIDTTQVIIAGDFEGKPIYAVGGVVSIASYIEAWENLKELYPEYENTTDEEKNQIFNLALMNNKELRQIAKRCVPLVEKRTKGLNEGSYAVQYALSGGAELRSDANGGEWSVGSVTWYTRDDFSTVLSMALSGSESSGKEMGGYFCSDGSSILNDDPSATSEQMNFVYFSGAGMCTPIMDFHIHPNNNLNPSEADLNAWSSFPWSFHYIYGPSGDIQAYEL